MPLILAVIGWLGVLAAILTTASWLTFVGRTGSGLMAAALTSPFLVEAVAGFLSVALLCGFGYAVLVRLDNIYDALRMQYVPKVRTEPHLPTAPQSWPDYPQSWPD
jgi:hypothetical protein